MSIPSLIAQKLPKLKVERNFSLARRTTIGVGGEATLAAYPARAEECAQLLSLLARERIPHYFLGTGANVLPSDDGFDGVIVKLDRFNCLYADGNVLFAGAGITGGALCKFARLHGLGGLECFTGIPTSVGGGIAMNAGVAEGHFSDVVARVIAVEGGKIRTFERKDCHFSTKNSVFLEGIAVLGAYLNARYSDQEQIDRETCYFRRKRAHLPKGRSMGCTFVNPENGESAGKLVEECGLKGERIGGAVVSIVHANFILNEGATAEEISALIALVKAQVLAKTGICLREEIKRIPQK